MIIGSGVLIVYVNVRYNPHEEDLKLPPTDTRRKGKPNEGD